jgi:UTP:GlnB (protein PII) uridylyltransferase
MKVWRRWRRSERTPVTMLADEYRGPVVSRQRAAIRIVGQGSPAAARIATAPPGYLLAHGSSDVARHCGLLSPLPAPAEARMVATPGQGPGEWCLDVASRDRPGLLAAFTGVFARSGIEVVQAVLATWDDGGALEAFVVRSPDPPDVHLLEQAFEASLDQPLWSPAVADAEVSFDDQASLLYTRCDVRAADRPGLLHAVAVAIAAAGVDVHAARVTTVDGVARDRFDLSDRRGGKLDPPLEMAIVDRVQRGVVGLAAGPGPRAGRGPGLSDRVRRDRSVRSVRQGVNAP